MWELEKSVVVYLDGEYLGDDDDLMKYICERYQLYLSDDFHLKGKEQLAEILAQTVKKGVSLFISEITQNFFYCFLEAFCLHYDRHQREGFGIDAL